MIDIKFTKFIRLLYQGVPNRAEVCYKDRVSLGLFDINTPKELVNDNNYFLPVFENILGVGDGNSCEPYPQKLHIKIYLMRGQTFFEFTRS